MATDILANVAADILANDVAFVSIQKAMLIAGVSRRTIYTWLNAGKLTYRRTAGGSVRIDASTLFRHAVPVYAPRVPMGGTPVPATADGPNRSAEADVATPQTRCSVITSMTGTLTLTAGERCVLCSAPLTTADAIERGVCELCG